MAEETPKEKSSIAYDLIYKPAACDSPRSTSPPKEDRPLSLDVIDQKLKAAAERKQALDKEREEKAAKERQRQLEALEKIKKDEEDFSRRTAEQLAQKMEAGSLKREQYYKGLQERVQEHICRVNEVRSKNKAYLDELKLQIESNLTKKSENRERILGAIKDKLLEHDEHVIEVRKLVDNRAKEQATKSMERMEQSMKNKEKQLNDLLAKLKEHDKHVAVVRQNSQSLTPE